MKKTVSVLLINPNTEPEKAEIIAEDEEIRAVVGGTFEVYKPIGETVCYIMRKGSVDYHDTVNRVIVLPDGRLDRPLFGAFFIAAYSGDYRLASLSDKQMRYYQELYCAPLKNQHIGGNSR